MKKTLAILAAATVASHLAAQSNTVATDPVGYNGVDCPANSDTFLSIPFHKSVDFVGLVDSASGNAINIEYTNTPPLTAGQFQEQPTGTNSWFVLMKTGPRGGRYYDVTNNGSSTLYVDLQNGEYDTPFSPGEIDGAEISVIPHWTLASAFPASDTNVSFIPSPSALNLRTEIKVPDLIPGINKFPTNTFYYQNYWRKFGGGAVNYGYWKLRPFTYFFLRNKANATRFTPVGTVPLDDAAIPLFALVNSKQDNYVTLPRPVDVSLNESGLTNFGAFRPSASALAMVDQLLVYTNQGINRGPAETYYVHSGTGNWRKFGAATTDFGPSNVLKAGFGFIVRKGTSSTEVVEFINEPNYLAP